MTDGNPAGSDLRRAIEALDGSLPDLTIEGQKRLSSLVRASIALGDSKLEASATYYLGRALTEAGDFDDAARCLDRARGLSSAAGDQLEVLRVGLGDIALGVLTGNPRQGVKAGRRALSGLIELLHESTDAAEQAAASRLIGQMRSNLVLALTSLGDFEEALHHSDAVIAIAETYADHRHRALVYSNRGYLLIEMGRPRLGLPWVEGGAELFDALDTPARAARSWAWSARGHALLGNYGTSLERLTRAQRDLADLPGASDHHAIVVDMARVYSMIGRSADALALLDVSVPTMVGAASINDRTAGLLLQAELLAPDDPQRSRPLFRQAHQLLVAAGHDRAAALATLALAESLPLTDAHDLDLFKKSILHLRQAGTLFDQVRWRVVAVEVGLVSDLEERKATVAEAEALAAELAAPHLQWRLAFQRGLLEIDLGDLAAARTALAEATEVLHHLRSNILDEALRTRYLADHRKAIDALCSVLLELDLPHEIIELLDVTYGVTLKERLRAELKGDPLETSAELSMLYDEMLTADSVRLHAMQARVTELQKAMTSPPLTSTAPADEPAAKRTEHHQPPARSASDPRLPEASMVVFGELGSEVFAVVVPRGKAPKLVRHLATIAQLNDVRTDLALVRRRAASRSLAPHHNHFDAAATALLADLFDLLIRPLDLQLGTGDDRLVVVPPPSGVDVTFAALHDGTMHLAERVVLTLSPSPSVAAAVADRGRSHPDERAIEFAPHRTLSVGVGGSGIPASILEASEIGNRTLGTTLVGADADVDRVYDSLSGHDVVHLATHALSRSTDPWFSGLQFADRWVTAAEIGGWTSLQGQLIVLSGCETGMQTNATEVTDTASLELLGLPRAFLAAGAAGVIGTLSDIDDTEAIRFMRPLHDHLAAHAPDVAVALTQRQLLAEGAKLSAWSTMTFVGGPSAPAHPEGRSQRRSA